MENYTRHEVEADVRGRGATEDDGGGCNTRDRIQQEEEKTDRDSEIRDRIQQEEEKTDGDSEIRDRIQQEEEKTEKDCEIRDRIQQEEEKTDRDSEIRDRIQQEEEKIEKDCEIRDRIQQEEEKIEKDCEIQDRLQQEEEKIEKDCEIRDSIQQEEEKTAKDGEIQIEEENNAGDDKMTKGNSVLVEDLYSKTKEALQEGNQVQSKEVCTVEDQYETEGDSQKENQLTKEGPSDNESHDARTSELVNEIGDDWDEEEPAEYEDEDDEGDEYEEEEDEYLLYGRDYEFFNPKDYLQLYSSLGKTDVIGRCQTFVMDFYHDVFASGKYKGARLVDVCSGPSINSIISASRYYKEVYLTEYARNNRKFLKKWAAREKGAFDWTPYFDYVAKKEGAAMSAADVEDRVRRSIRDIMPCDLLKEEPFGDNQSQIEEVDAITSCLTIEAAAPDHDIYKAILKKLSQCLSSGGLILLVGVLNQTYYSAGGDAKFYALKVSLEFVKESVEEAGFTDMNVKLFDMKNHDPSISDADGLFAMSATKK